MAEQNADPCFIPLRERSKCAAERRRRAALPRALCGGRGGALSRGSARGTAHAGLGHGERHRSGTVESGPNALQSLPARAASTAPPPPAPNPLPFWGGAGRGGARRGGARRGGAGRGGAAGQGRLGAGGAGRRPRHGGTRRGGAGRGGAGRGEAEQGEVGHSFGPSWVGAGRARDLD